MKKFAAILVSFAILLCLTFAACANIHKHQWGEWEQTKAPTCTMAGEETRVCKLDTAHKETRAIAKDGTAHNWNQWKQTKAPTVTDEGEETRTCKNDSSHKETRSISKLSHAPTTEMTLTSSASYSVVRGLEDKEQGITKDCTAQISLTIAYEGSSSAIASSEDVTFASEDDSIASVNSNGTVLFKKLGKTAINVKSKFPKKNGGYFEEKIEVEVNRMEENDVELEVIEMSIWKNYANNNAYEYKVKNSTGREFSYKMAYAYLLDDTGKIVNQIALTGEHRENIEPEGVISGISHTSIPFTGETQVDYTKVLVCAKNVIFSD